MTAFHYHALTGPQDALAKPWLDLFQDAFPLNEQMRFSSVLRVLNEKQRGESPETTLLSVLDKEEAFQGMLWYEMATDDPYCYLWYIAVDAQKRNKGAGSALYQEIANRARSAKKRALVCEVEHPDFAHDAEMARRRIGFYQRNGARLCSNIVYTQSVGWQPPVRMYLMIHPLEEGISDAELLQILTQAFGESMEPADHLELS